MFSTPACCSVLLGFSLPPSRNVIQLFLSLIFSKYNKRPQLVVRLPVLPGGRDPMPQPPREHSPPSLGERFWTLPSRFLCPPPQCSQTALSPTAATRHPRLCSWCRNLQEGTVQDGQQPLVTPCSLQNLLFYCSCHAFTTHSSPAASCCRAKGWLLSAQLSGAGWGIPHPWPRNGSRSSCATTLGWAGTPAATMAVAMIHLWGACGRCIMRNPQFPCTEEVSC